MNEHDSEQPTIPPSSSPKQHDSETVPPSKPGSSDDPTILPQGSAESEPAPTVDFGGRAAAGHDGHPIVRYFGEYELLEEIARGGMGVVYKAKQVKLNRLVALKMILSGRLAGEEDVKRFHTEAEAAANLDHPGIVPIYEVGEHDGQHYFSMAYVEGTSLSAAVANGPLPPKDAAQIVKSVTEAMAYAHDRGVIHRDLKPANILLAKVDEKRPTAVFLNAEGIEPGWYEPKVTDFGLAKQTKADSQITGTGQILGTPSYMPPEQAGGKTDEIGPLVDVYSLGAILYCLLTGRPPFQAANVMDTLMQVLEREPASVRELNPNVPDDLNTICLKCLEKKPERRFQSARKLANELQRFLNDEPILARPITITQRVWRWCRRKPWAASSLGLIVALLLILGVGGPLVAWNQAQLKKAAEDANDDLTVSLKNEAAAKAEEVRQRRLVEQRELDLIEQLHRNKLILSQTSVAANDYRAAFQTLTTIPFLKRNWETSYLYRRTMGTPLTIRGHQGTVISVAFSPDGRQIASFGKDRIIRLWDARTGEILREKLGHRSGAGDVEFSPDGKHIVSAAWGKTFRVWNAQTLEEELTLSGPRAGPGKARFSPNGRLLLTRTDNPGDTRLWDTQTGKLVEFANPNMADCIGFGFSPDGNRIISVNYRAGQNPTEFQHIIRIWNQRTGEKEFEIPRNNEGFMHVEMSPNGKILIGATTDATIRVWDVQTGEPMRSWQAQNNPYPLVSVAVSPDGNLIATGGMDRTINIWKIRNGQLLTTFRGHQDAIRSIHFSRDGLRLVSGSDDGTIKVWNLFAPSNPQTIGQGRKANCLCFNPEGTRLVTASIHPETPLQVWDTVTGELLLTIQDHKDPTLRVYYSQVGQQIISQGRKAAYLWNAETGELIREMHPHTGDFILESAISPDTRRLVSTGFNRVLNEEGEKKQGDPAICITDLKTGEILQIIARGERGLGPVAFSPDGKRIASRIGNQLQVWDCATGKELKRVLLPSFNSAALHYSPDGKQIATAAMSETVIRIWDASTGQELLTLEGHQEKVRSLAYSDDGSRLFSGSEDNTIKVWDTGTAAELLTIRPEQGPLMDITITESGGYLASAGNNVKLWDAYCPEEILRLNGGAATLYRTNFSPDGRQVVGTFARSTANGSFFLHKIYDAWTGTLLREEITPLNDWREHYKIAPSAKKHHDGWMHLHQQTHNVLVQERKSQKKFWVKDAERRKALAAGWHEQQAKEAMQEEDWFAAQFHLRHQLQYEPENSEIQEQLDQVERSAE